MKMMSMMMSRLQKLGSYRKLHTIISKETIKPSSPTPPHLKTHVLTLIDSVNPHFHMPFVYFYNHADIDINILKKSLSLCLTQYYPFAGQFSNPSDGYVDCNDAGAEFVEASHDTRLDEFLKPENYERIRELIPSVSKTSPNMLEVQLNRFPCGGVALAVSVSHKVTDGTSMVHFANEWARVTRGGSPGAPIFAASDTKYKDSRIPENVYKTVLTQVKHVLRVFRFPNSKINELKKEIIATGSIDVTGRPLTRTEVLSSLLVKHSVDARTTMTGAFKPSVMFHPVNMRKKFFQAYPEKVVGNLCSLVSKRMEDEGEVTVHELVDKLRKGKMEVTELKDIQETGEKFGEIFSKLGGEDIEGYWTSSVVGYPLYEIDFGWGKPVQVDFVIPDTDSRIAVLTNDPHKDWVQAAVHMPEEEMMILQQNKELLKYVVA